jgi:hypothetical protein
MHRLMNEANRRQRPGADRYHSAPFPRKSKIKAASSIAVKPASASNCHDEYSVTVRVQMYQSDHPPRVETRRPMRPQSRRLEAKKMKTPTSSADDSVSTVQVRRSRVNVFAQSLTDIRHNLSTSSQRITSHDRKIAILT